MGFHGALLVLFGIAGIYLLIKQRFDRIEKPAPRESGYEDGVIRAGVVASVWCPIVCVSVATGDMLSDLSA